MKQRGGITAAWVGEATKVSQAHWDALRLFKTQDAIRMLPDPEGKTVDDLHAHIRSVVFGENKIKPFKFKQPWSQIVASARPA